LVGLVELGFSVLLPVYHSLHIKATSDLLPRIVAIAEQEGFRITDFSVPEASFDFLWAGCWGFRRRVIS
jgi:hypothetical protein